MSLYHSHYTEKNETEEMQCGKTLNDSRQKSATSIVLNVRIEIKVQMYSRDI